MIALTNDNFKYHYCYNCDSEKVYSNLRRNGKKVDWHCTTCGTYQFFNDGELKERYYKKMMNGVR